MRIKMEFVLQKERTRKQMFILLAQQRLQSGHLIPSTCRLVIN